MTNALNGKVGTLMLLNDKKTELSINTVYGTDYDLKKRLHLKLFDTPRWACHPRKAPHDTYPAFFYKTPMSRN